MTQTCLCPHHEQVSASHPDHTDIREGLHDVIESGGGESMDRLARVIWDTLVDHLKDKDQSINYQ